MGRLLRTLLSSSAITRLMRLKWTLFKWITVSKITQFCTPNNKIRSSYQIPLKIWKYLNMLIVQTKHSMHQKANCRNNWSCAGNKAVNRVWAHQRAACKLIKQTIFQQRLYKAITSYFLNNVIKKSASWACWHHFELLQAWTWNA